MKVKLLYFHRAREAAGCTAETATLATGATATDALHWAIHHHPALAPLRSSIRLAVNEEYAARTQRLHEGDVVAFLPPLSGG